MKPFLRIFYLIFIIVLAVLGSSCGKSEPFIVKDDDVSFDAKVITLDVENGSATLIKTPNATILIDCGAGGQVGNDTIEKLKAYKITQIDYFILTHIDENHIGNTKAILENFNVKNAFVPDVLGNNLNKFPTFNDKYSAIKQKVGDGNIFTNVMFRYIKLDGGFLTMLSPQDKSVMGSSYDKLLSSVNPEYNLHDNTSPIIYFSYKGVRFIFANDAGVSEEKFVLTNNSANLYNFALRNQDTVELDGIDFLTLSSHGNDSANSPEFINELRPKNAIISLSADNKNCPKSSVLESLLSARSDCKIFSTMLVGDICAYITANGEYIVKTQKDTQR